ncbi:RNA polymerase sigma factor [Thermoleophilia bacterium SCSIO 60948]|nr:RNA polymerase sigma factor [Thermoleophilia bacterium SCSIO 60948]
MARWSDPLERSLRSPERFEVFYRDESGPLLRFLARRVLDPEVALDLTAETFARALDGAPRLRARGEAETLAWLYAIARNVLADYFRDGRVEHTRLAALRVEVPAMDDQEIERVEELAGLAELRARVRASLDRLSASEREAVELRVVEELSYADLASRLGVTEQAARARVSRGLRHLESILSSDSETKGCAP